MGTKINCHLGMFELPSQILEVGIFDDFIQCKCEDGMYRINKNRNGSININKICE